MKGWHRQEPYDYEGVRGPILFRRLLWRALEEGIVSRYEARELLPGYDMTPEARLGDAEFSLSELLDSVLNSERRRFAGDLPRSS